MVGSHAVQVITNRLKTEWVPVTHVTRNVIDTAVMIFTTTDTVFVNDIAASCHVNSETVGKMILAPLKLIYSVFGKEAMQSPVVRGAFELYSTYIGYF